MRSIHSLLLRCKRVPQNTEAFTDELVAITAYFLPSETTVSDSAIIRTLPGTTKGFPCVIHALVTLFPPECGNKERPVDLLARNKQLSRGIVRAYADAILPTSGCGRSINGLIVRPRFHRQLTCALDKYGGPLRTPLTGTSIFATTDRSQFRITIDRIFTSDRSRIPPSESLLPPITERFLFIFGSAIRSPLNVRS